MVTRILRVLTLTSCLQAEVFSDFLVVTRMGEVEDAVASKIHLEDGNKKWNFTKTNTSIK